MGSEQGSRVASWSACGSLSLFELGSVSLALPAARVVLESFGNFPDGVGGVEDDLTGLDPAGRFVAV